MVLYHGQRSLKVYEAIGEGETGEIAGMMPHLSDNVLNSIFDRVPRLIRDVVVDFREIPRHVVRESSSASCRRSGEGLQCRWKAKGCSIGGVKLYEGTTNGGEA